MAPDCEPEDQPTILAREGSGSEYRGNVKKVGEKCEVVETEGLRWAGMYRRDLLKRPEYPLWVGAGKIKNHPFYPTDYWAGIDCSGLVQQSLKAAQAVVLAVDLKGVEEIAMTSVGAINAEGLVNNSQYTYYQPRVDDKNDRVEQQKKLRKGDLVWYKGHVSIVYSDKTDENGNYQIIHAFGTYKSDHDNKPDTKKIFSRKVIVTSHKATKKLSEPYGYGRIRLW